MLKTSRPEQTHAWRPHMLGIVLAAILLAVGPAACLSDVAVSACETRPPGCVGGAGSGAAGPAAGATAMEAGSGGRGDQDFAGSAGDSAGSAGELGGAGGGSGGNAAGTGGTAAGTGGSAAGTGGNSAGTGGGGGGVVGTGGACEFCQISPEVLPAPCGSNAYSTTLTGSGGTAPYDWHLVPAVDGWSVARDATPADGSHATLSGQAPGPTNLTIELVDATGAVLEQTYPVQPRGSCLFAYTSLEAAGPRLELRDPVLASPPVTLAHNQGVYDFAFSPNGQFLAYRFGADATYPKGRHLALLDLTTLAEQPLTFAEDAVTAFSWSNDSSTLAVSFASASISYLGGVKLVSPAADQRPQPIALVPVPAFVDSDLYWVGGSYLAFYAAVLLDPVQGLVPNPYDQQTAFYAALGPAAFSTPVALSPDSYSSDVTLQPSDNGFFMITPTDPFTYFNSVPPSGPQASHSSTNLISPSGHLSAELADDQLQLFAAKAGDLNDVAYTSADDQGCPKLLAWAKNRERIACVADVQSDPLGSTHGEVRIFDVTSSSATLMMSALTGYCVKDTSASPTVSPCAGLEYDYTEASSAVQARAFSASGRWFAFTTGSPDVSGDNYLYWADLSTVPSITLKRKVFNEIAGTTSTSPTALAFSADENYLLLQRGNVLTAHDLNISQDGEPLSFPTLISTSLATAGPSATANCSEDFPSAPDRWCGSADRVLPWLWAPDSRYAAYRGQGTVTVADLTQFLAPAPHVFTAADCNQQCAGQLAFQPQP